MKYSPSRRFRRRAPAHEAINVNKENKQEQFSFGESFSEPFFKPVTKMSSATAVNRKCADCEVEQVQRAVENKEEDEKKIMKKEEKKEEEKLHRAPEKKEEEKLMKKEERKDEEKIRKKDSASSQASSINATSHYIQSINGNGKNMDPGTRSFFESRMNTDFSKVKIHTGKEAADSAKEINAQAYTYGNHIVFNEGKYSPESSDGKHLLAHELMHVVQQSGNNQMVNPTVLNRKVGYSLPDYKRRDPIPISVRMGGGKLGETFITLNKIKLDTREKAIKTIFEAFNKNLFLSFDEKTKTCKVDTGHLKIDISAEITLPTDPVNDKWTGQYAGSLVNGSPTCSKLSTVNIEMISVPSGGEALLKRVRGQEAQHFTDIIDLSERCIEAYYQYLEGLTFKADSAADCPAKLLSEIGNKDLIMAAKFADEWIAAKHKYDNPQGTHHTKSVTDARNCNLVRIIVHF